MTLNIEPFYMRRLMGVIDNEVALARYRNEDHIRFHSNAIAMINRIANLIPMAKNVIKEELFMAAVFKHRFIDIIISKSENARDLIGGVFVILPINF